MSPVQLAKIDAFMAAATRVLNEQYRPDCCIAASRIACMVLGDKLHMKVRPLSVHVCVSNPAMIECLRENCMEVPPEETIREWAERRGAWTVRIGGGEKTPGRWPGHLVALVYGKFLIDLTLTQADRPQKGIRLAALSGNVPDGFAAGRECASTTVNGCLVDYWVKPDDRSFEVSKDWHRPERHRLAVRRILDLMALQGARHGR